MFRILQLGQFVGPTRFVLQYSRPSVAQRLISHYTPLPAKVKRQIQEREPCPKPEEPSPQAPKEDALLWLAVTATLISGGFIVYARNNDELRDWLTLHAPWVDDIIAVAFQENQSYGEFVTCKVDSLRQWLTDTKKPEDCSNPALAPPPPCVPPPPPTPAPVEECEESEEMALSLCEIENCVKETGVIAIDNLMTARDACIVYNKSVFDTLDIFTLKKLRALRSEMEERKALVKEHMATANTAMAKMDEVGRYFECQIKGPKAEREVTDKLLCYYERQIEILHKEFECLHHLAIMYDDLWQRAAEGIESYVKEIEYYYPEVNFSNDKPMLDGNGDILLIHANRYVKYLYQLVKDAQQTMQERVNRAMESLPTEGAEERNKNLKSLIDRRIGYVYSDFRERMTRQREQNDKLLTNLINARQKKFEDTLEAKIESKEKEMWEKLDKIVEEEAQNERQKMENDLDVMKKKVEAVEQTLNDKLKAERESRRSQDLWVAASSLLNATRRGGPVVCINKELSAIEKAAGCDDSNTYPMDNMVAAVLKAIPSSVRDHGIVPESVLRERYPSMEQTALDVAMVEADGAPLPVYVISWIQSLFLFMKLSSIPKMEMELKPDEEPPEYLDTFDLLQRARYWIDNNNIPYAVRYVGALSGASRGAANAWYESAKAHLETRQAAEAIIAYAKALGIQYL